jgi:hypothetical protein
MGRYTLTAIIALSLAGVGIAALARGQIAIGILSVGIAALRLGAIVWARRPRKPEPSIRLNIDDEHGE